MQSQQYVCAGEPVALQALTNVLVYLKVQKIDIANVRCALFLASYLHADLYQLTETYSVEKVKEILGDVVTKCFDRANAQQIRRLHQARTWIRHHTFTRDRGVMPFRTCTCNVFLPDVLPMNFCRPF